MATEKLFKGYLHHKIRTSQNVSSELHVKYFYIPVKHYAPSLRYSVFVFLATTQTSKSVTPWGAKGYERGYIFEYIF